MTTLISVIIYLVVIVLIVVLEYANFRAKKKSNGYVADFYNYMDKKIK